MNKKKKNFYYALSGCFIVIFCVLLVICIYLDGDSLQNILKICMAVFIVAGVALLRAEYLEEKDNPISLKKIKVAIQYVTDIKQGIKEDFVKKFSLTMYDHLVRIGIIHQIRDERVSEEKWEVTVYGLKKAINF